LSPKRVVVVADPYTVYAFRMLGAEGYPVNSIDEARKVLRELAVREDIAILFISAEFYDELSKDIEFIEKNNPTLVVSRLPTIREPGKPMDVQKELLRALGMG
jgi:V/A-type H+-transporting ATPase subunit F